MSNVPDLAAAAADLCSQRGYSFLGELGNGAFKRAYLVQVGGDRFALKLSVIGGSPERLVRESTALRTCSHTSIARLDEAFHFQHGSTSLWVTREEFCSGGTLENRLAGTPLQPDEVRRLGCCLADVLGHLHDRRLVHRDIKPANILFRDDPTTPVLTDFGVVRMLDQPTLTHAFLGMGPGTPAFAAPEQLNNEKLLIDWRTDQFGLAVVLCQCLTGTHPFMIPGGSIQDAITAVASKQAPPSSTIAQLSSLGFGCLERALQPWPVARYRKPVEFLAALGN